jgi:hypothetical protein
MITILTDYQKSNEYSIRSTAILARSYCDSFKGVIPMDASAARRGAVLFKFQPRRTNLLVDRWNRFLWHSMWRANELGTLNVGERQLIYHRKTQKECVWMTEKENVFSILTQALSLCPCTLTCWTVLCDILSMGLYSTGTSST